MWAYLPMFLCTRAMGASSLASPLPESSSRPSSTARLSRTCKRSLRFASETGISMMPQSGTMQERLTVGQWLAWLTSLQRDSPVNLTPRRASEGEQMTPETSGPIQRVLLGRLNPDTCSWRIQESSSAKVSSQRMRTRFWLTLPRWGMTANGELWVLEMSEHPTGGTGGGAWPTPKASVEHHGLPRPHDRGDLQAASLLWPTPRAEERMQYNSRDSGMALSRRASEWPTPLEGDVTGGRTTKGKDRPGETGLRLTAQEWVTPRAEEARHSGRQTDSGHQKQLVVQAVTWATPTTRDHKDGANPSERAPTAGLLGRQAPRTPMLGQESSTNGPNSRRRLNPLFVEWLMGLPIGWTDLEPVAMASYRRWYESFCDC